MLLLLQELLPDNDAGALAESCSDRSLVQVVPSESRLIKDSKNGLRFTLLYLVVKLNEVKCDDLSIQHRCTIVLQDSINEYHFALKLYPIGKKLN